MKLLPLIALIASVCTPLASAQAPKPNIIFVLVDDLGWGDLGVFFQNGRSGNQKIATPKLDSFANEGTQLRRHYCPAPVCAPSRASLLLGAHQGHSNIRNSQFDQTLENNHTLGTVMRGAGYATACLGKWGLQGPGVPTAQPSRPQLRGFDYFFGYSSHRSAHIHYPEQFGSTTDDQGQPLSFLENTTIINSQLGKCYSTDLITARAKKWIIDHRSASPSQPFFIYLTYPAPHARLDVPTQAYPAGGGVSGGLQWIGTSGNMINTASGTINSWIHPDYASTPGWTDAAKRYATMVRRIDDAIGDLIQTLDDLSIDDDTLIVFSSDNGPTNEAGLGGAYTYDPRFFDSYGPFEGIKRDLLEGGTRVPTLVRWPGTVTAGAINQTPAQFHDWMATFAQFAGVPKPARADGVSLAPILTGIGTQITPQVYTEFFVSGNTPSYTQFPTHGGAVRSQMQSLYLNGYKGVRTNLSSHATNFRIYDTLNDPAESTNLAGQPGVPTQQQFKDRVLQLRRVSSSNSRSYDSEPIPAITPPAVVNGLDYRAYEMTTPWVPDWSTQTSVATGNVPTPNPSVRTRADHIGLHFSGYIQIPTEGTYTFHLTTDTGAFIRIHDAQLLDADFGYTAGTEKPSGTIPLKAGYHPIRIDYRHATAATHSFNLQWEGPGIAKQAIPSSVWFRADIPVPVPPSAVNDSANTTLGQAITIPVLSNDSDDGFPQPLSIASVSTPTHGSAVIVGNSVLYTPAAGFVGEDSFTYLISDGQDTDEAIVSINVLPISNLTWLPFDESSGNSASDALGNPIGTLSNFTGTPWIAGKLGNALSFDGVNDGVVLTNNKGITGGAARTVSFFLNANASQTANIRPTLVSWGTGITPGVTGARFDINLNHTGSYVLRVEVTNAGVNFTTPTRGDLRGKGWVHCAVVVPANATVAQVQGYLDGQAATATLEPSAAGATLINTSALYDITIGRTGQSDQPRTLNGLMDDVRIYPRALSATEIAALASQTPDANLADLWYHSYTGIDQPTSGNWAADGDQDGFNSFLEFALGGNPTANSQTIAPRMPDTGNFIFNRRLAGLPANAYVAEISPNLQTGSWNALGTTSTAPHPALPGFEQVTVQVPTATRNFVRLRVTGEP
ncbi:MAG: sulfatase-like hydrolase/transferase [Akkermansiaceae bacterium]|nr:sulfatase-like hydrolase/transferase [Akkermansiaceae bacterium]